MEQENQITNNNNSNTGLGARLESLMLNRISTDSLILPIYQPHVLKCQTLLRDPNFSLKMAKDIIEQDQLLLLLFLRSAQEVGFSLSPKRSIEAGLNRMGMARIRTLFGEVAARQVFESQEPLIMRAYHRLWEHSIAVGRIAQDLCGLSGVFAMSDYAFALGMLHDIGKPIVASMLLEAEKLIADNLSSPWIDSASWLNIVHKLHRKVGVALVRKWALPEDLERLVTDMTEYEMRPRVSAVNCVKLANALAKRDALAVGEVDQDLVASQVMMGRSLLSINATSMSRMMDRLKSRLRAQNAG